MKRLGRWIVMAGVLLACAGAGEGAVHADDYWGPWDVKNDPAVLGKKVVQDLIGREFPANYEQRGGMSYPEVCCAYGALRFSGAIKDQAALDKLVKRYAVMFSDDGSYLITRPNNVDNSVFGILPMEIYRQTGAQAGGDKKWLELGKGHADAEFANPRSDGLSRLTRFWIDDMFMITALQVEAYRVTQDKVYLDRAAREMVAYLDRLQKPNGLFYHGEDSPFYWSRGNGWMAAGSAELLSVLPADHPDRPMILDGYRKMMAGLLKFQGKDGMWRQLIDNEQAWPETSGSGMFTFAMALGVRNGWLDEATYKEPARRAWVGLSGYLNPDGKVREVCAGTNKGYSPEFYLTRPRLVGDYHGQAGFVWAAWAMVQQPAAPGSRPATDGK